MLQDSKVFQLEIIQDKRRGQIMLITLLVLVILGVIISGIVIVLQRDTSQVVVNEKYEQLYNSAEANLKQILDDYATYAIPLSSLPTNFTECLERVSGIKYECSFNNSNYTTFSASTTVEVEDVKRINGFEVQKDDILNLSLNNYRNNLNIKWDGDAAIELGVIYLNTSGEYKIVKDVFDPTNLFSNTTISSHSFTFSTLPGEDPNKSFSISLDNIVGVDSSATLLNLTITPRMSTNFGSIRIDVEPLDLSSFPYQMRVFRAVSFDGNGGGDTPVVRLETQVPLNPQIDSIFDYSLLTDSDIGL
jgi:type II secretory pathway pseudopilin PulG